MVYAWSREAKVRAQKSLVRRASSLQVSGYPDPPLPIPMSFVDSPSMRCETPMRRGEGFVEKSH